MALFEVTDYDRKVWQEELKDFLPDKILDVHTHVYKKEHKEYTSKKVDGLVSWTNAVAEDDPIEDLQETYRLLFPGKEVTALMFGIGNGRADGNVYVKQVAADTGWPALYYSHSAETADELEQKIREGGFLGTKSYLNMSPSYIPAAEARILDFFPPHQLERLNEMGAIVMCHIPRDKRLIDPVNYEQIAQIKRDYPKLRFIVAHVGRTYTHEDLSAPFAVLDQYKDLKYDFSANCCEYAITEVIRHAGVKNVMFGTDMPILRMRTHRIEENGTYVNLVPPGLYYDPHNDPHLREVSEEEGKKITFFAYEELLAFKRAAKTLHLSKQDIEDIMYNNAVQLIEGARRDIYGV